MDEAQRLTLYSENAYRIDSDLNQLENEVLSSVWNDNDQQHIKQSHQTQNLTRTRHRAELKIIEQPASKALRFRYECEGRSAGSLPGANSTLEKKTYPEITIKGYHGNAIVLVSCVTQCSPYLAHPHNLVGKDCTKGVCVMHILPEKMMRVQFQNLGIQCVKKKEIELSLAKRQEIRVDPFKNGFQHKNRPTSIDLNAIRLCFQAYLPDQNGKMTIPLKPIVSDVIYDKKAIPDLTIVELCSCVSYVNGGSSLILLCEKIAKGDVEIHFFEEDAHGNRVWQRKADFRPSDVHKQAAIKFKTPSYHNLDISEPVRVYIQLYRPSDHMTSEALPFEYLPLDSGYLSQIENKKRKRTTEMSYRRIFEELSLNQTVDVNQMLTLDPFEMQPSDYAMANQSFIHENLTPIASISPQCIIPECNASLNDGATSTSPSNNIHSQNKHQSVRLNNFNGTKVNVMSTLDRVNIEPNEEMFPFKNEMNENSEPTIDFPSVNSIDLQKQLKEIPNSEPLKEIGNLSLTDL